MSYWFICIGFQSLKIVFFILVNSVEPQELSLSVDFHLDLHCLSMVWFSTFSYLHKCASKLGITDCLNTQQT